MENRPFAIVTLLLAVAAILLFCDSTYSQKLKFEHINISNGLSHNDVMSLMQDQKGYIWIGTLDGLNKYDGYNFTHYQRRPFDSTSITSNVVTGLWKNSDGKIWVHPVSSDLNLFDPETGVFSIRNPLPANKIHFKSELLHDMEEDKEGMIWVVNDQGQLCRFNKKNNQLSGEDLSAILLNNPYDTTDHYQNIGDIFSDNQGAIWIGSSEGLHRLNSIPGQNGKPSRINFTHYWRNPNDTSSVPNVAGIFEDRSGQFWLTSSEGLTSFDRQTKHIVKYRHQIQDSNSLSDNRISGIAEDAQGNLWIATHHGLNRLDKKRQHFTRYYHNPTDPTSLSGNLILTILIDKSNTLWVGTVQGGISKVSLNYYSFPLFQHDVLNMNSLSNNKVTAISEDSTGIIWIGTLGGGLNAWNRATQKFTHYKRNDSDPASLVNDSIGSVIHDKHGNVWIGSGTMGIVVLSKMDQQPGKFQHHVLRYPSIYNPFAGTVFTIYEDKGGLFWIGTVDGVVTFDPVTKKSHHYPYYGQNPEEGLSDPWIFSFCEDRHGDMWIGTSTFELNKLNRRTGKYTHYTSGPKDSGNISSHTVRCIFTDSKGTLWFGTFGGGLCRLNTENETFTAVTMKEGLPSNSIHSIQEDDEGNLWLGTGNGLSRFSPATGAITNYDMKDGLQSNQSTVGHTTVGASFKGKDGTLYFGGVNGFNAFHPKFLQPNQHIPPVVINQFKLFDKVLPGMHASREVKLEYDQNFFSFEFAALDYTNSPKNQYAYKLEGFDKDWVYSGTRRLASYTGVTPGEYTFRVKGSNNDGVWNEEGTSIKVIISPPWWQTNLAYAFYVLCFIAVVYSIHRFQHQRIVRKERERSRELQLQQAKEIEEAYHQLKTTQAQLIQSEKMASLGELTAGIAHEIQNPLNFVNNFSEINKELIEELKAERQKEEGLKNEQIEDEILDNIEQNLEKVLHHGRRADAIVKGMLQHSRNSTGAKEPTNINALADEYLRLAYHGLRAKDKQFNVEIKTEFDASVGNISVVPQDIGRVLLNLYNNAFYAVKSTSSINGEQFAPTVKVTTKRVGEKVEIRVADNGPGIPQKIVDKIFQPFFTTKPTGQGTGLGLSLAYDIIKTHGADIKVNTQEGKGSEFIILFHQNGM